MRILITGSSGFIGYHLSQKLLDKGYYVLGIDNINNYYDPALKIARNNKLEKNKNFIFNKIDITDKASLKKSFEEFKPDRVVNLAAQAGVRYSITNPYAYLESNLVGFINIIEMCRNFDIDGLIYASSSSVYGSNKKMPFSVNDKTDNPIALYGATKKANELIANSYSHLYGLHTTGLRFFTVYGPWGRPDMAMYIFTKKIEENKPIPVFNNGKMKRDFTYIDDIINGTISAIEKNYLCEIFNIGNNKSERLLDVIKLIESNLNKKATLNFLPMQPGDVKESFADIDYTINKLNFNPKVNVDLGVENFIKWYKKYNA